MVRIIDAEHFLPDGDIPRDLDAPQRRQALQVARFIEYAGPLTPGQSVEMLVECRRRFRGRRCPGVLWALKTPDDNIEVCCLICRTLQYVISNWRDTLFSEGVMVFEPPAANE